MTLTQEHLGFVRSIAINVARRYPTLNLEVDELTGEGALALVRLSRRFDSSKAIPFKQYAQRRIAGSMADKLRVDQPANKRELRDTHTVQPLRPADVRALNESLNRLPDRLRSVLVMRFFHEAEFEEIGKVLGVGEECVFLWRRQALKLMREYLKPWNIRKVGDVL